LDENGKKTAAYRYIDDQLVEKTTYELDEKGRLIKIVDENQYGKSIIQLGYDENGNIIKQEEYDQDKNLLNRVYRRYDKNNNLIESDVFIDGRGERMSQKYVIRYKYEYY
jgi:antitoxin component YwqK of YwqJK toxin-antitoxin module